MRNRLLIILIGILSLLSVNLNAQWIQSGGPIGGIVFQFAKGSNGKIWAASANGLYYSTTNGNSWQRINKQMPFCAQVFASGDSVMAIYRLFERASTMNAEYNRTYCITSINNGATWNLPVLINNLPFNSTNFYLKRIGNSFVLTSESSAEVSLESNNFGQTWVPANTLLPNNMIIKIMYSKQTAFHSETRMNFPLPAKRYDCVSFNGKASWSFVDSSCNENLKVIGAVGNAILFFNDTNNHKILRSTNLGGTYDTVLVAPAAFPKYGALVNDGEVLYAYFYNNTNVFRAYKSDNKGVSWTQMPPNFPMFTSGQFVQINNNDYMYQTYFGVRKYSLTLDSSMLFVNDIKAESILKLVSTGSDLYGSSLSEVYRSSDDGGTWVNTTNKFYYEPIKDLKANGDIVAYLTNDSLFVSANKGITWSVRNLPFTAEIVHVVNGKLFLNSYNSSNVPYQSSDLGQTWTASSFGASAPTGVHHIVQDQDTLFDLMIDQNTLSSNLFRYEPGLNQFVLLGATNILLVNHASDFVRCGNKWFSYGADYGFPGPYCFSNDGLTWSLPNTNSLPVNTFTQKYYGKPIYVNGVFYAYINDTTMISSVNGSVWNVMSSSSNLGFHQYTSYADYADLVNHKDVLYMPTNGSGVWRRNDTLRNFSGNVYFDANNNGIKDGGEINIKNVVIATKNAFGNTNSLGIYNLQTDQQGDSLKPTLMSPSFTSNPPYIITNKNQLTSNHFGIYAATGLVDFSVDATNNVFFRPGFASSIVVNVHNHAPSNQTSVLSLTMDPNVQFSSASPSPSSINGNVYTWNLPTLAFSQNLSVHVYLTTKLSAVLGDTVMFAANIIPSNPDINIQDNIDTLKSIIVGAYDPNDKTCKQGAFYTVDQMKNKEALEYVIRFQNTGTFPASYVRIEDTLSTLLDWSTIQVVNASHPMNYTLSGKGVVHFMFDPIQLPGMAQNEPESHGFVKYTILPKNSLAIGNIINNTAHIYFDFNTPIVTNTTSTMYTHPSLVLANDDVLPLAEYKNHILIYPNPANTRFTIHFNKVLSNPTSTLHVFDMQGKKVLQTDMLEEINTIDCSNLQSGLYFGVIYDKRGNTLSRFKITLNR